MKKKYLNKNILDKELKKFLKLYKQRPIKNNKGGMKINHMFAFFFILRQLKPKFVVESGVFKGQGTWLIEKALPSAKIFAIDINLNQRTYVSRKAKYLKNDFKYFDEKFNEKKTLAFFDDHTCHYERILQCKFLNIKHIIFEDNYRVNTGDFNSLKNIFKKKNYLHNPGRMSLAKTLVMILFEIIKKFSSHRYFIDTDKIIFRLRDKKNLNDNVLKKNINFFFEFPKILSILKNEKLKETIKSDYPDEIESYNNITYINLK